MAFELLDGPDLYQDFNPSVVIDFDSCALDDTRFFTATLLQSSSTVVFRAGNVTGGNTLNFGAPVTSSTYHASEFVQSVRVEKLATDYVAVAVQCKANQASVVGGSLTYAQIINVSGLTITEATAPTQVIDRSTHLSSYGDILLGILDSTHFLVASRTENGANLVEFNILICTTNLSTITTGFIYRIGPNAAGILGRYGSQMVVFNNQTAAIFYAPGATTVLYALRISIDIAFDDILNSITMNIAELVTTNNIVAAPIDTTSRAIVARATDTAADMFVVDFFGGSITKYDSYPLAEPPQDVSTVILSNNVFAAVSPFSVITDMFVYSLAYNGAVLSLRSNIQPDEGGVSRIARLTETLAVVIYESADNVETAILVGEFAADAFILGVSARSSTAFVTLWANDQLLLNIVDLGLGEQIDSILLSPATFSEIQAKTFIAYPYAFSDTEAYIFGRMATPTGIVHILYTIDAGNNFSVIENGWGTDYAGALVARNALDYFVMRCNANKSKLYQGNNSGLGLKSTLPFSGPVTPHGMRLSVWDDSILAAVNVNGEPLTVLYALPPYLEWEDITANHPQTAVNAVVPL